MYPMPLAAIKSLPYSDLAGRSESVAVGGKPALATGSRPERGGSGREKR
jgi:hypothetical protein